MAFAVSFLIKIGTKSHLSTSPLLQQVRIIGKTVQEYWAKYLKDNSGVHRKDLKFLEGINPATKSPTNTFIQ